jgi:SRSO17 transposase
MFNSSDYSQKKGALDTLFPGVVRLTNRFSDFCDVYSSYFDVFSNNVVPQARCYVAGLLMKAPRKNMERMEEYVQDCDYESIQQFLTDSPWDEQALQVRLAQDVNKEIGGKGAVLCIDESAITKKGDKSVGVARQWNGRLGKTDNCQVGVFASLVKGHSGCIIGKRLYLPREWTDNKARCECAGIPKDKRVFKTKPHLALELIDEALAAGVEFRFVCMDAFYGNNPQLLRELEKRELVFVADVHMNQGIYTKDPEPYLPRRRTKIGPKYKRLKCRGIVKDVKEFIDGIEDQHWKTISVRESTKGTLTQKAYRQKVWLWDGEERKARPWWLTIVRCSDREIKAFICNAGSAVTLQKIVEAHALRYWIERTFQDAKTSIGMADYQARKWNSWQHHMTLVSLAMLFGLRERLHHNSADGLLTYQDIVELLDYYLPRTDRTEKELLENIKRRHLKRLRSIESAYSKKDKINLREG